MTTEKIIISTICKCNGIKEDVLFSKSRKREIVESRQMFYYFMRKYTRTSLEKIGVDYGDKNHATVHYSDKTIKNIMEVDRGYDHKIKDIQGMIEKKMEEYQPTLMKIYQVNYNGDAVWICAYKIEQAIELFNMIDPQYQFDELTGGDGISIVSIRDWDKYTITDPVRKTRHNRILNVTFEKFMKRAEKPQIVAYKTVSL